MTISIPRLEFSQRLARFVAGMTSVVSYPKRCRLWGNSQYRGNCDGRLFLGLVLRYGARRVGDPMMGSGTTRDVVEWLNAQTGAHIDYWGGDLRTGFNLSRDDLPGPFDFVWVHPPYWKIIRYSDHADDLSTINEYTSFVRKLAVCLDRCYTALTPGGRLAVLIGDVRRSGVYTPIVRDVLNFEGLGSVCSILIKVQHNCRSDSKQYASFQDVRIAHEYCVVFQKPMQAQADAEPEPSTKRNPIRSEASSRC